MNKGRKRFSIVFVFVFALLGSIPANAAIKKTSIPQVQFVGVPETEYMAGDRIQFNVISPSFGGLVEYRVVLWDDAKKSYSDLWNEKNGYPNRYYTKWQPRGNGVFTIGWPITEPGNYRITVYAKRVGVASGKAFLRGMNYDSYTRSAAFTVKPKVNLLDKEGQTYGSNNPNKLQAYKEDVKITAKNIALSNAKLEGDLYITGDNAVIKNLSVAGNIVVDPGHDGSTTLDSVRAKNIEILSGGQNSIHIKDVQAESMNIGSSTPVRIEADGDTEIISTSAAGYVIFDRKSGTFGTITINKDSNGDTVVEFRGDIRDRVEVKTSAAIKTGENSKVSNLIVDTGLIRLEGNFGKVEINSQARVEAGADTRLESIVAHEDAQIYLEKTTVVDSVDKGDNTVTIIRDNKTETGSPSGNGEGSSENGGGVYIPPPAAVSAVTITGSNVVGETLTAELTPSAATAEYQWKRSNTIDGIYTDITGATSRTYTLTEDDAGKYIKVAAAGTGRYIGIKLSEATEAIVGIYISPDYRVECKEVLLVEPTQLVTLKGAAFADGAEAENLANWEIDTGTTNFIVEYISKITPNTVLIKYELKTADQGWGFGTVTVKAKASAVDENKDTNTVSYVIDQSDSDKVAAAKAAIRGASYINLVAAALTDDSEKEAAVRAVVDGLKGETTADLRYEDSYYYVIIHLNNALDGVKIEPVTFASNKAELAGAAGLKDNTPGAQTGEDALNPIAWEISVENTKAELGHGDISVSPKAAFKLYSNNSFTTEVKDTKTIALTQGKTKIIYIKVTAEDGRTVKYYAVKIYRALPAHTGALKFTEGIPAVYMQQITVSGEDLEIKTNLVYTWYRSDDAVLDEEDEISWEKYPYDPISQYAPQVYDVGKYLIVAASSKDTGRIVGVAATLVGKAPRNFSVGYPEISGQPTSTEITLMGYSGFEYAIAEINSVKQSLVWQSSNIFTGLTPNTYYAFVTRLKEDSVCLASLTGDVAPPIKTAGYPQTGAPAFTAGTPPTYGKEIIVGAGNLGIRTNLTYTWYCSDDIVLDRRDFAVHTELMAEGQTESKYTVDYICMGKYIIVAATSTDAAGNGIVVTERPVSKAEYTGETVKVPTIYKSDLKQIILTSFGGYYEYAISSIDGVPQDSLNWQSSTFFTGLAKNTEYKFKSRVMETSTTFPSAPSEESVPVITKVLPGREIIGVGISYYVLQMGETETRTAITPEPGAGNWTSSNPDVAEIDSNTGVVTAKGPGTTAIAYTTSDSGYVNSILIEVYDYAATANPEINEVRVGERNVTLSGYINPGEGQKITWSSSNTRIAFVISSTGSIAPVAPGSTIISYIVTESSTGRIVARGQLEITVQP